MALSPVVITGMGMVSPLGCGVEPVWQRLTRGQSGVGINDRFDVSEQPVKIAGLVPSIVDDPEAGLDLDALIAMYPPRTSVEPLPAFPAIERDLSLILDEATPWAEVDGLIRGSALEHFESLDYVGSYRGKQVGSGKKSVTLRMRFRHPSNTLRHEDVDPQMSRVIERATKDLGAEIRT